MFLDYFHDKFSLGNWFGMDDSTTNSEQEVFLIAYKIICWILDEYFKDFFILLVA